jgi:UDP-glucose 4-epimerase
MIILTGSEGYIGQYFKKDKVCFDKKIGIDITEELPKHNPELIYHLAAQTSVQKSFENPEQDFKDNVLATLNMLRYNCKIIFTSTGAVYGDRLNAKETDEVNPQSPYAENKVKAENIIIASGIPYVIIRIGNVYGRDMNKGVFKGLKESGKIFGDGTHTRDYIHIDDVLNALEMAQNWDNGIYNIGTNIPTSVNQIADKLGIKKEYAPEVEEQKYISLNINKAVNYGWKPTKQI